MTWQERFREQFALGYVPGAVEAPTKDIEAFISEVIAEERQAGRDEACDYIWENGATADAEDITSKDDTKAALLTMYMRATFRIVVRDVLEAARHSAVSENDKEPRL